MKSIVQMHNFREHFALTRNDYKTEEAPRFRFDFLSKYNATHWIPRRFNKPTMMAHMIDCNRSKSINGLIVLISVIVHCHRCQIIGVWLVRYLKCGYDAGTEPQNHHNNENWPHSVESKLFKFTRNWIWNGNVQEISKTKITDTNYCYWLTS